MIIDKHNFSTIVLASNNINKLNEFNTLLPNMGIQFLSSRTFNLSSPVEDGQSFEENAIIKAQYVFQKTQTTALSDDSGFEVSAIGNLPGIYSARWALNDDYNIAFKKIEDMWANNSNKKARFVCCLCLYGSFGYKIFKGVCEGQIVFPPEGTQGFGYDSIFIPEGDTRTFASMSLEQKSTYSHRGKALAQFKNYLLNNNG